MTWFHSDVVYKGKKQKKWLKQNKCFGVKYAGSNYRVDVLHVERSGFAPITSCLPQTLHGHSKTRAKSEQS